MSTTTPSTPAGSPPRGASAAEDVEASTPQRRAEDDSASTTPPRVGVATPAAAASLSPYSQQQHRFSSPNANDLDRPLLLGGNNGSSAYVDLDDFGRPRLPFHVVLLRALFRAINVLLLVTGIAMIGAAADELARFQHTAAPELRAKAPWFLIAVGGAGAAISLTALLGLAAASASSGRRWVRRRRRSRGTRMLKSCFGCRRCCPAPPTAFLLGAYAAVLSALLVCQVALALALSADASWRKAHLPEDPTGDEEAVAALIARQLSAAWALAAVALALQLLNVGIAGALGGAHVSALEAAAEGRAFVAAEGRHAAAAAAAAREGSYLDDEPGWGATRAPRLPPSPARGTFIPISSSSSSPERQPLLLPPSMQQQQQQQQQQQAGSNSGRGCLLM